MNAKRGDNLHIAVVDDEQAMREQLTEYIQRFSVETNNPFEVFQFASADALLKEYRADYEIIIFDIDMPGTNGLDAARKIRETDGQVMILFVTNMAQYAINGYEVDAVDYVIKPIGYYDFSMKLQKALRRRNRLQDEQLVIDSTEGMLHLPVTDILYVEVMGHYLVYHTQEKTIRARGSLKESEALLLRYHFSRCHKSFLVNLAHIINIRPGEVLAGTESIPLGRAYKDARSEERRVGKEC